MPKLSRAVFPLAFFIFLIIPLPAHATTYSCDTDTGTHCTPGIFACAHGDASGDCAPGFHCCYDLFPSSCGAGGINTGLGCLETTNTTGFVSQLLTWGIGIAGGIGFIVLAYAGIMITTAAGDPKRVKAGQELAAAVISGLVLIILSVVILNFIGVKILNLPPFGFSV